MKHELDNVDVATQELGEFLNQSTGVVDHEELAQMVERVAEAARAELDTLEQEVEA